MRLKIAHIGGAIALATTLVVAGCGSGGTTTADEDAAFKKHDASAIPKPPPDAMKPPSDFHSSLDNGKAPKPPGPGGK